MLYFSCLLSKYLIKLLEILIGKIENKLKCTSSFVSEIICDVQELYLLAVNTNLLCPEICTDLNYYTNTNIVSTSTNINVNRYKLKL